MKSKIEKLNDAIVLQDGFTPEISFALSAILQKQGEIIDHLNSQDQEEYEKRIRIKGELSGETEHIKAHKEYLATSKQDTPEKRYDTKEILRNGTDPLNIPNGTYPVGKKQDTPEEWKEVNKDIWYMVGGKKYVNINGEEYIRTSNLEQLLDERERWAIDTFLKDTASYNSFHNGRPRTMRNGLSGEGFEVRVSKLNKKK